MFKRRREPSATDCKTVLLQETLKTARHRNRLAGERMATENESVGHLLVGEGTLLGKPFALVWPDGYPCGFTMEDQVKEYGRHLQQLAKRIRDDEASRLTINETADRT